LKEKEAVLKLIEKIDEKRKKVFFSCLEKLSMHFNSIFNSITGGIAELELEDPNDLESGLIIKATPKGKTLLNLDAMSGGEKTITALSFLFAVQKLKPAPFYILDEADAMLDRENTKKIAEMIRKFSRNSQFIAITHNDQTIKYGDVVYGVTMLDGESKIVGLKLPRE
jgi:chromosome segregation protein